MSNCIEAFLEQLLSILEDAVSLHEELQSLLQQEHHAVVGTQLDALSEIGRQKEDLLVRLHNLEDKRKNVMEKIANEVGVSPQRLSLSHMTKFQDGPVVDQIKKIGLVLKRTMDQIKRVNRNNQDLLRHSLEFVHGSMTLLKGLMTSPTTYLKNGRMHGDDVSGRMIHRQL